MKSIEPKAKGPGAWRALRLTAAALVLGGACAAGARAQPPPTPKPAADESKQQPVEAGSKQAADAKLGFTLRVTKEGPVPVYKLVAKNAKVADIAADLARRIEAPVQLSPLMQRQRVTVDFNDLDLEAALRFLAPVPLVDYVAGGADDGSWQPKPLAVYLYAVNEEPPSLNETVKSNAEAFLIEGHTEEGTEEYEKKKKEEPLEISFTNNRLSVRAEKQPLTIVLLKIATALGIPVEVNQDTAEVVDLNFQQYPVDEAMRALSPSVRLFYRANLSNSEKYPIRLALPTPGAQAGARN